MRRLTFVIPILGLLVLVPLLSNAAVAETPSAREATHSDYVTLRKGYGLYADAAYVGGLDLRNNPKGYEDFPFPIAPDEAQAARRAADVVAAAGDWFAGRDDPNLAAVEANGAETPSGVPRFRLLTTDPSLSLQRIQAEAWAKGATFETVRVPFSRDELEAALKSIVNRRESIPTMVTARVDAGRGRIVIGMKDVGKRPTGLTDQDGIPVEFESSQGAELTGSKHEHVYLHGSSPGSVWSRHCVPGSTTNCFGNCTTNIVVSNGSRWQMTAQHCLDDNYFQYWTAYNGRDGYHLVAQSSYNQKYTRADGYDVGFWYIPPSHATKAVFMKQGLYRTNIGTMNPVHLATYCFSGQDTQTATYGIDCGSVQYDGYYLTNSGENYYGWAMYLPVRTFQLGDSGATIFQQLVNSESRTVGVFSARSTTNHHLGWFAPAVPPMQAYGMIANW